MVSGDLVSHMTQLLQGQWGKHGSQELWWAPTSLLHPHFKGEGQISGRMHRLSQVTNFREGGAKLHPPQVAKAPFPWLLAPPLQIFCQSYLLESLQNNSDADNSTSTARDASPPKGIPLLLTQNSRHRHLPTWHTLPQCYISQAGLAEGLSMYLKKQNLSHCALPAASPPSGPCWV
jgi:hypothetical protein